MELQKRKQGAGAGADGGDGGGGSVLGRGFQSGKESSAAQDILLSKAGIWMEMLNNADRLGTWHVFVSPLPKKIRAVGQGMINQVDGGMEPVGGLVPSPRYLLKPQPVIYQISHGVLK